MRQRPNLPFAIALVVVAAMPAWLPGRRRSSGVTHGKELRDYRNDLIDRTTRTDTVLGGVADALDALRRRDIDVDLAMEKLVSAEEELDEAAEHIREMLAPEELHPLHLEYDANLERALRGIVTAERGCGITKLPHRPPEDEEPFTYWKRGHANVTHARMRMQELAEVMVRWQPGRPSDLSVGTRLHRDEG